MSATALFPKRAALLRPKYLLAAFVTVMFGYVLIHNENFIINSAAPVWTHYQPFKWWLLPHALAGGCALILVPLHSSLIGCALATRSCTHSPCCFANHPLLGSTAVSSR